MKKLLATLGAFVIVSSSAASAVACGSNERTITSIEHSNNDLVDHMIVNAIQASKQTLTITPEQAKTIDTPTVGKLLRAALSLNDSTFDSYQLKINNFVPYDVFKNLNGSFDAAVYNVLTQQYVTVNNHNYTHFVLTTPTVPSQDKTFADFDRVFNTSTLQTISLVGDNKSLGALVAHDGWNKAFQQLSGLVKGLLDKFGTGLSADQKALANQFLNPGDLNTSITSILSVIMSIFDTPFNSFDKLGKDFDLAHLLSIVINYGLSTYLPSQIPTFVKTAGTISDQINNRQWNAFVGGIAQVLKQVLHINDINQRYVLDFNIFKNKILAVLPKAITVNEMVLPTISTSIRDILDGLAPDIIHFCNFIKQGMANGIDSPVYLLIKYLISPTEDIYHDGYSKINNQYKSDKELSNQINLENILADLLGFDVRTGNNSTLGWKDANNISRSNAVINIDLSRLNINITASASVKLVFWTKKFSSIIKIDNNLIKIDEKYIHTIGFNDLENIIFKNKLVATAYVQTLYSKYDVYLNFLKNGTPKNLSAILFSFLQTLFKTNDPEKIINFLNLKINFDSNIEGWSVIQKIPAISSAEGKESSLEFQFEKISNFIFQNYLKIEHINLNDNKISDLNYKFSFEVFNTETNKWEKITGSSSDFMQQLVGANYNKLRLVMSDLHFKVTNTTSQKVKTYQNINLAINI